MKQKLLQLIIVLLTVFAAQAQELSVCTYNLRYKNSDDTNKGNGWNTRRTYLINLVNFQQPDLLGVQEALKAQMDDMANGLKGYAYIGVGRNDGGTSGEYSAIFYRKDRMVLLDNGDFWLSDTPWKPSKGFPSKGGSTSYYRICSWGKFYDKLTGKVVYHFNTHLDLDETNRQQSFYLIKQKIQEIASTTAPVIVSGDYNAVQTGDAYKLFLNSGFLYDCYTKATTAQRFITNGTCPGFDANNYSTVSGELRRIDHIFISKAFDLKHYGVLNPCYYSTSGSATYYERAYSDHSPVFAKLAFKASVPSTELNTTPPPTVDGVYQLSTPEELQAFAYIADGIAGFTRKASASAVLLNDIDMAGMTTWQPIGTNSNPYSGTFDGQGHTIKNIVVKTGKDFSGLFGKTSGATIKNFSIAGTITVSEGSGEHGVVGYAENTTITDVHSSLNITAGKANVDTKHIGGIAGTMASNTTINRCSYSGTINDAGTNTVGGIVGYADQTNNIISNAINYGSVKSKGSETNTGGILGYVNYKYFRISSCANVGSVSGNATYAGQILGRQMKAMSTLPSNLYYLEGSLSPFGS
ncbi:MAG: endonuclease/exonuclease/phosphatase family protein, partial [Bacteroidaceae bacterium]|nr:endonuclease/exonuclease/phosphatase family protein [Bacteroidaceae bacterium]